MGLLFSEKMYSCCFSGHRYMSHLELEKASENISLMFPILAKKKIYRFYSGGALGFDLAAAATVINYKKIYPEFQLILALPCENHTRDWSLPDISLFNKIMERADSTVYVSDKYARGCMQKRNRYMVDRSSICICWLSKQSGGTFNTAVYARKNGIDVINLTGSGFDISKFG